MQIISPILSYGTYGVHIIKNPAGTYSFFGAVPEKCLGCFKTFDDALAKFFEVFKSQPVSWQRENVGNMRNDIFEKFLKYNNQ